jgi:ABC-type cobalamin transport system permease subunit
MTSITSPRSTKLYTVAASLMVAAAVLAMYFINLRTEADRVLLGVANAQIVAPSL